MQGSPSPHKMETPTVSGLGKKRLRPIIEHMLNNKLFSQYGLEWINGEKTCFRLPWKINKRSSPSDGDAKIIEFIAKQMSWRGTLTDWKASLRNDLNNLKDFQEVLACQEKNYKEYRIVNGIRSLTPGKGMLRKSSAAMSGGVSSGISLKVDSPLSPSDKESVTSGSQDFVYPGFGDDFLSTMHTAGVFFGGSSLIEETSRFRSRSPINFGNETSPQTVQSSLQNTTASPSMNSGLSETHLASHGLPTADILGLEMLCDLTPFMTVSDTPQEYSCHGDDLCVTPLPLEQIHSALLTTPYNASPDQDAYYSFEKNGVLSLSRPENTNAVMIGQDMRSGNQDENVSPGIVPEAKDTGSSSSYTVKSSSTLLADGSDTLQTPASQTAPLMLLEIFYDNIQVLTQVIHDNKFTLFSGDSKFVNGNNFGSKIRMPGLQAYQRNYIVHQGIITRIGKVLENMQNGITISLENENIYAIRWCRSNVIAKVIHDPESQKLERCRKTEIFNMHSKFLPSLLQYNKNTSTAFCMESGGSVASPGAVLLPSDKCRLTIGVPQAFRDDRPGVVDIFVRHGDAKHRVDEATVMAMSSADSDTGTFDHFVANCLDYARG